MYTIQATGMPVTAELSFDLQHICAHTPDDGNNEQY